MINRLSQPNRVGLRMSLVLVVLLTLLVISIGSYRYVSSDITGYWELESQKTYDLSSQEWVARDYAEEAVILRVRANVLTEYHYWSPYEEEEYSYYETEPVSKSTKVNRLSQTISKRYSTKDYTKILWRRREQFEFSEDLVNVRAHSYASQPVRHYTVKGQELVLTTYDRFGHKIQVERYQKIKCPNENFLPHPVFESV